MATPRKLWVARVIVPHENAEIFTSPFEEASLALTVYAPPRLPTARIEAIYDSPPDKAALITQLALIALLNQISSPTLDIEEIPKLDWLKKVAADFPPLPLARWVVHGAQHRRKVPDHRSALQIDATSAFGTGEHPTTHGCLILLDGLLRKESFAPRQMLDMGCGSGILAMAWAQERKGRRGRAVAVDLDPESVVVSRGNVRINGLQSKIKVGMSRGYTSGLVQQNGPYDLIMANIFAGPLSHMAADLRQHLKKGGYVILSGLLSYQANRVISAHRMQGLKLEKRLNLGEWVILLLRG